MDQRAAISGFFADFKTVKTRSTAQLIIEIPIEGADEALAVLGGVPQPGNEKPVAIARLVENQYAVPPGADVPALVADEMHAPLSPSQAPEKPASGRNGNGRSRAQQAGIACQDARFKAFLKERYPIHVPLDEDGVIDAAATVRLICVVDSRAQLDTDPEAGKRWDRLYAAYVAELR